MKKRWISLLLVLALLASLLAGCRVELPLGGETEPSQSSGTPTQPSSSATQPSSSTTQPSSSATQPSSTPTEPTGSVVAPTQPSTPQPSEPKPDDTITLESTHTPTYANSIPRLCFDLSEQKIEKIIKDLQTFKNAFRANKDLDAILNAWNRCEDNYEYLSSQYSISEFYYKSDLQDETYTESYLYTNDMYYGYHDVYVEVLKTFYNMDTEISREFFSSWSEEEISVLTAYDPEISKLEQENNEIVVEFEKLTDDEIMSKTGDYYVRFVKNNQKIAQLNGYDNYYEYAHREIYMRDYELSDLVKFRKYVGQYVAPMMPQLVNKYQQAVMNFSGYEYYQFIDFTEKYRINPSNNYLRSYFNSAPSPMRTAFLQALDDDYAYFADKDTAYDGAFCGYIETLGAPYCFFGSQNLMDTTIAHELGHYYALLHLDMEELSYDLAETHSQSNEWFYLHYLKTNAADSDKKFVAALEKYQQYSAFTTIVVATMVDDFEYRIYTETDYSKYSDAYFTEVMSEVCKDYGGEEYISNYITDAQYYWRMVVLLSPCYYISYATSGTAAYNLYLEAQKDLTQAYDKYMHISEKVDASSFVDALAEAKIPTPFDENVFKSYAEALGK